MGDTAGQLADRLHFQRLAKLLLQIGPLGQVARRGEDERLRLGILLDGHEHHVDRAGPSGEGAADLIALRLAAPGGLVEMVQRQNRLLGTEDFFQATPDDVRARAIVSGGTGGIEVDVAEAALRITAKQAQPIERVVEERLHPRLRRRELAGAGLLLLLQKLVAGPQRLLGAPTLRGVAPGDRRMPVGQRAYSLPLPTLASGREQLEFGNPARTDRLTQMIAEGRLDDLRKQVP